jgi:hypothetical protein
VRGRRATLAALALAAACRRDSGGAPGDAAAAAPRFELAGCAAVTRGPVCEVTEATRGVRIWVTPEDASVRVSWGTTELPARVTAAEGGKLVAVEIPAGVGGTLHAVAEKGGARATFQLPVRAAEVDPRLARARTLHRAGQLREALAVMPDPAALPAAQRGRALGQRARLDLAAGHVDEAVAGLRASLAAHRQDGRVSDEVLDGMALTYALLTHGRRQAEARAALAALEAPLAAWDEGRAQIGYYRALADRDGGDVRAALRELDAAERGATRLGLPDMRRSVRQVRARLLHALGRADEARATLRAEIAATPAADACAHAELVGDLGWIGLLEREGAATASPDAELAGLLDEARAGFEERCPRAARVQNAHVNLALLALQQGDVDAVERHLARARGAAPTAEIAGWLLDVGGRVALLRGRGREALDRYDELTARARTAAAPEVLWRALLGRGRALALLDRDDEAVAAYREAERLLDRQVEAIPLAGGRAGFLGQHGQTAALLAEALVRKDRPGEAALAVRLARARGIASAARVERVAGLPAAARARWEDAVARYERERDLLDEDARDDWALSADKVDRARAARRAGEARAQAALDDAFAALGDRPLDAADLAPPREGELLLVYQALPGAPARGFAVDASGAVTRPLILPPEGAPAAELARALLEPFASEIARARRVRVLATGPLLGVDVHALPFPAEPLLARVPVEYPLDLPAAPPAAARPGRPAALVVADGRNNLGGARREAEVVAGRLAGGFQVETLVGDAAQKAAVLEALGRADLFHFGGHGIFAGRTGWESSLALSDAGALTLGDVLALPRVPARVVLSGCETSRSAAGARVVDVSLAAAFVSAGAGAVIAAARPVADDLAAALAAALYADAARPGWDPASAFDHALLAVHRTLPAADWASYRVITR